MTIAEVLAPYQLSEDDYVAELASDLRATPEASVSQLSSEQESILAEHGGMRPSAARGPGSVPRASLRALSANLAELTRTSLSVAQAAERLNVDASRVRHRLRDRALYGFRVGATIRLPLWQFGDEHRPIPGLRAVLAALPPDLHPLEIAGFATAADADLTIADQPVSPRDWLAGGGAVAAVCELASDLDRW